MTSPHTSTSSTLDSGIAPSSAITPSTITPSTRIVARRIIAIATAAASIAAAAIALSPVTAAAAPSLADASTVRTATALPETVVRTGSSATVPLGAIPTGSTAVVVTFTGVGAWRNTDVSAATGKASARTFVMTASKDARPTSTVTIPIAPGSAPTLTVWSSQASVRLTMSIERFVTPTLPTAATPPAPPAPTAQALGAGVTGVPAGTALTVHNGDLKITQPGAVIDGLDIRGVVSVQAPHVTIKNSIVRGRALAWSAPLISATAGHAGLTVVDTEIFPSTPSPNVNGIFGYNFTLTRVNIHGVIDAVHLTGGNVVVQDSWLHDNLHYASDPNHGGTGSHDDSIQIQTGDNIRIVRNTISGAYNAGLQITQDRGRVSNVTFANNRADGGGCTVNVAEKSLGPIAGIVVTDNAFGRNTRLANCAVISPTTTKVGLARNVYVPDNTTVTVRRG